MKKIILFIVFMNCILMQSQNTHLQVQGNVLKGTCNDNIILRGMNYAPYNWGNSISENDIPQIAMTKANSVRIVWYKNATGVTGTVYNNLVNLDSVFARCVRAKMIPIIELHDATCSSNVTDVTALLPFYTSTAFKALELKYRKHLIINIANEAGQYQWSGNPAAALTAWKTTYSNAIINLRNNGLQVPIMIDALDCGTNSDPIVSAGQQILAADPLGNVIFSVHGYWISFASTPAAMTTKVNALVNTGLCITFGEIANYQSEAGNGCDYLLDYISLLGILKANNIGWLSWVWSHDNCTSREVSTTGSFSNLSAYGAVIVNNPNVGLIATAVQALQFNATCSQMGINDNGDLNSRINVFPNPVVDFLNIEMPDSVTEFSVVITNMNGKVVSPVYQNKKKINVQNLPNGIYIAQIKIGKKVYSKKFIKKISFTRF